MFYLNVDSRFDKWLFETWHFEFQSKTKQTKKSECDLRRRKCSFFDFYNDQSDTHPTTLTTTIAKFKQVE